MKASWNGRHAGLVSPGRRARPASATARLAISNASRARSSVASSVMPASMRSLAAACAAISAAAVRARCAARAALGVEGDASGRFDPPYSTCIANTIEGGTAQNILARKCRFTYEVRSLPGVDGDAIAQRFADYALGEVLPWIQRISPDANITITRRAMSPPLLSEPGSDVESFVMALAERNAAEAVSYATEAGIFQDAGIPAVVCGPGDIAQAHQPGEYIEAAQIPLCEAFMRRLIGRLV